MRKVPVQVIREATIKQPAPQPSAPITLDALAQNLALIASLTPGDVRRFTIIAGGVFIALQQAMMSAPEADKLLDIKEAATRLGVSTDYLYRNFRSLPYAVTMGRAKRFSAQGIERAQAPKAHK